MARPKGSRNRTNASNEISQALSKGLGLLEFKNWLADQLKSPKVSDAQKTKYATMYQDLMKYIHTEALKLEAAGNKDNPRPKEDEGVQKGENTTKDTKTHGSVTQMNFGKKRNS